MSQVIAYYIGFLRNIERKIWEIAHFNMMNPKPDSVIKFGAIHIGNTWMTSSDPSRYRCI